MHNEIKTYPIDDGAKHFGEFIIKDMGNLYEKSNGQSDKPHRHAYYTVIVVDRASGTHLVDFHAYELTAQQLFFIYPGQVHQLLATNKPKGTVLNFSAAFLVEAGISGRLINDVFLYNTFGESPPLYPSGPQFDQLKLLLGQMKYFFSHEQGYLSDGIGALLKLFLIHSVSICSKNEARDLQTLETGNQLLRNFKALLDRQYNKSHKVGDYALELAVTADYLNKTIKSLTGKSAKELIQQRVLLESKRVLLFSDLSSKEIAFQLGFEEPAHFSNFFKKQAGITPAVFREKARQN